MRPLSRRDGIWIEPYTFFSDYKIHSISYSTSTYRLHQAAYRLGDLSARFHPISWATEARRIHSVTYTSVATALAQAQRFHSISYSVVGVTTASRYHTILYEGSGTSGLVADQRLP